MKFATSFYQTGESRNKMDEIRFPFQALTAAIEYANANPDKRAIVEHKDIKKGDKAYLPYEKMYELQAEINNLYYDFYDFAECREYAKYSMAQPYAICHYMFHAEATNWGLVQILLYYHVSDITVGEPLVFQCTNLAALKEKGVTIRVKPHQPAALVDIKNDSGIKHFWVLPQHVTAYEPYIDVFDLITPNHKTEELLIKFYSRNTYEGPLKDVFINMKSEYAAGLIDEKWLNRRFNCGQRCMEIPSKCSHCDQMLKYYDLIKDKAT